MMTAI